MGPPRRSQACLGATPEIVTRWASGPLGHVLGLPRRIAENACCWASGTACGATPLSLLGWGCLRRNAAIV
eukprot:15482618-Alexandrium_andersonii.AAC.1